MDDPPMEDPPIEDVAAWARGVETHRVIAGRRWRTSDPRIPEDLRQALVDELMAARRAIKGATGEAQQAARDRVHDAKVALGERGLRWWTADPPVHDVHERIRRTARALGSRASPSAVAMATSTEVDAVHQVLGGHGGRGDRGGG